MKLNLILSFLILGLLFSCTQTSNPDYTSYADQLKNSNIFMAIAFCNTWRDTDPSITSYVTPQELIVQFPNGTTVNKPLPDSVMYVAVAPYLTYTHTCSQHYISSCQAELKLTTIQLTTTDSTGSKIFDGTLTTLNNGFVELWLSRNKTFNLHVVCDSKNGDQKVTTFSTSNTCITTMKLQ